MSVVGRCFLTLILGVILTGRDCRLLGLNERTEALVKEAACSLECSDEPSCTKNCTRTKQIEELDEKVKADARLVCRDAEYVVLAHNPGNFVIETLVGGSSSSHRDAVINDATQVVMSGLAWGITYQFRLRHLSTGGMSMPETTEQIKTLPHGYWPLHVTDITIGRFKVDESILQPFTVRVKISFSPSEDRPCFYEVRCQQDDGEYNRVIYLTNVEVFSVDYGGLPFAANFTLTIKSLTDDLTWINSNDVRGTIKTFSTPRCLVSLGKSYCVPKSVIGLNATATHKTGNIFNVYLTWVEPDDVPAYVFNSFEYSIDIQPIGVGKEDWVSKVVDGPVTNVEFRNVKILDEYEVYIRAKNDISWGPKIRRRFTTGLKRIDVPEDIRMPIYLGGTILIMVIGISIAAYGYYRHRKRRLNKPVDKFEMSPDRLTITRVLGTGAFGVVKLGSLRDDQGNVTNVAVKMLQDDSIENELRSFRNEIELMKSIGKHPNLVSLLGCCMTSPYPFLVVEYCSRGDLQSYLRKSLRIESTVSVGETKKCTVPRGRSPIRKEILQENREDSSSPGFSDDYIQVSGTPEERDTNSDAEIVTMMDMLNFGRQIATGMEFLSSSRIVHRDLATRNVLVCRDRTVKISDFGLSRDVYQENFYIKWGNGRMPLKWMAIEALTHQVYTTYSDVWSFGILLWEIVTLGGSPYPGVPTIEILARLLSGYRMTRPANCSDPLYNVMLSCWQERPKDRPTFTILRQELDKLICAVAEDEYFDLNEVPEETPI